MQSVNGWFSTWWLRVPEPRDISIVYAIIYAGMLCTGIATVITPPRTIEAAIGPFLMTWMGVLLMLGSLLAMVAGSFENWLLERVGLVMIGGALACYVGLILSLQMSEQGSRLTQLGVVGFAAIGVFVVRYLLIRGYTYRPRG